VTPTTTAESWPQGFRIVSSRFPPVGVFDDVSDRADLEAVFWVEGLTNPRLREALGQLELVPPDERLAGPGTTPIMAAFTHLNPNGSRFSDGSFGVYYAGRTQDTAVAETVFHTERWALESQDPPTAFTMRVYIGEILERPYHDLRGEPGIYAHLLNPDLDGYGPAQQLGQALRAAGSWGILYPSVRDVGGECAAVFRPSALGPVHQSTHLAYVWDGTAVEDVIELRSLGVPGR
jgi:hypothetical protein